MTIRRATAEDVDVLVDLRIAFVTELSEVHDPVELAMMVRPYLEKAIPNDEFLVWVAEDDDTIVAVAGMVVYERLMGRGGVGREGYVLNVYTLPERRREGHGARVMHALQAYARDNDIRLTLIATDHGRPLYERLGWTHDNRNYRWLP
jgi:ribosomal protein S18 acetylase RimI-like enzyme